LLATIGSSTRPLYSPTLHRGASSLAEAFAPVGSSSSPSSTIFCTTVNMATPVALRDVARRVTSVGAHTRGRLRRAVHKMPCVRSLPGVDATRGECAGGGGDAHHRTRARLCRPSCAPTRAWSKCDSLHSRPARPAPLCDERRPHPRRYTAEPAVNTPLPHGLHVER
jgi:hypothetical protein